MRDTKEATWGISIDDDYCEWRFPIQISGNECIASVYKKITRLLGSPEFDGMLRKNRIKPTKLEDKMETYTVNGVTYKQLEDITVKALIWVGARDMDADKLTIGGWLDSRNSKIRGFSYLEVIPFDTALDYASSCSEYLLVLLVDQGFVEVVEEIDIDYIFRTHGIQKRTSGNLGNKSVYLNEDYSWTLEKDDENILCLVPKQK